MTIETNISLRGVVENKSLVTFDSILIGNYSKNKCPLSFIGFNSKSKEYISIPIDGYIKKVRFNELPKIKTMILSPDGQVTIDFDDVYDIDFSKILCL